ncbi:hypothetical protein [Caminibacter pacificus]|uniref:Uncharacterized protein n=1 Tax=Caminibacter pacificus TaxID=1424653 RepID=A0AAJ4RAJ9_9BACT|nr:hypothetical protein [Caminibacter pacificus]QDD68176.1 hypothetical protein C6V80_09995 [Caminibacter pacificus]ROR38689.1 hypothetical protein EDC58_1904 [Caminibacter pacificus]
MILKFQNLDGSWEKRKVVLEKKIKEETEDLYFRYAIFSLIIIFIALPDNLFNFIPFLDKVVFGIKVVLFIILYRKIDSLLFTTERIKIKNEEEKTFYLNKVSFFTYFRKKYPLVYFFNMFYIFVMLTSFNFYGLMLFLSIIIIGALFYKFKLPIKYLSYFIFTIFSVYLIATFLFVLNTGLINALEILINISVTLITFSLFLYINLYIFYEYQMSNVYMLKDKEILYYVNVKEEENE